MSGIPVPYSVAILGVNNDATLCDTTLPSLSSIPLDAERAGYTAAQELDNAKSSGASDDDLYDLWSAKNAELRAIGLPMLKAPGEEQSQIPPSNS